MASFSGGSPIIDVERINDALYVEVCGGVSMDVFVNLDHQGIRSLRTSKTSRTTSTLMFDTKLCSTFMSVWVIYPTTTSSIWLETPPFLDQTD